MILLTLQEFFSGSEVFRIFLNESKHRTVARLQCSFQTGTDWAAIENDSNIIEQSSPSVF